MKSGGWGHWGDIAMPPKTARAELSDQEAATLVKWVLQQMGRIPCGIRLPLTPLSSSFHDLLRGAMDQAGLVAQPQPA